MLFKLFAILGMAVGLLVQVPQAQAATAQFELHFRCSPWLYLSVATGDIRDAWERSRGATLNMDIDATNARLCKQNAEAITYAANTVFALNGVPVNFSYTTEVLAGGGGRVVGLKFRAVTFTHDLHDDVEGRINGGNVVPDIYVDDLDYALDVDTSTCNPFATAADCTSLVGNVCPPDLRSFTTLCKNAAGGTVFLRASPFPAHYHTLSMFDTDTWSAATAPKGARRINITLRVTAGTGDNKILGIVNGAYDRASTALSLNDGTLTRRALTPGTYLPTMGVVTLVAGPSSLFNIAAAPHEIGHVFGALHERSSMLDSEFYALAGLATGYQFANAISESQYVTYDTLMVRFLTAEERLNFSTTYSWKRPSPTPSCPPGKTCPPAKNLRIGDTLTDNRRYVAETIQWITGDASFTLTAPSDPAYNTLSKAMKP